VLSTRSSKNPEIYSIKKEFFIIKGRKGYESVNLRLRPARHGIRRPWTDDDGFILSLEENTIA
jgi:hypothetical protein